MSEVWCIRTGVVPYEAARECQLAIEQARHAGEVPDVLLLLEHPPVYTRGRRSDPSELPMGEEWYRMQGIEVSDTDRGGRVTYHGPGQLVGYPIIELSGYDGGVHGYVRRLERVMVDALEEWAIRAQVFSGLAGVWTAGAPPVPFGETGPQGSPVHADRNVEPETTGGDVQSGDEDASAGAMSGEANAIDGFSTAHARKLGAIGVHVRRGITTHGFAINVSNDLRPFEWIVPCGIDAAQATSLTRELGAEQDLEAFAAAVAERYAETFSRELELIEPGDFAERVVGAARLLPEPAGLGSAAP